MWIPEDVRDIERAARGGELEETPSFDAKADLPQPKKNADLATDVAAMATDGGVLLYGVAEDEHKRPTIPNPIPLAGAADRIGQIVSTSIAEVPYIEAPREYPCADDPSRGYLLVIVPQSARAPHQVTVGGDLRYYGRGAKGNRILTEGEVARLYERRQSWAVDRERVLAEVVAHAPAAPSDVNGYVHAYTRPVALDQGIFERAVATVGSKRDVHQRFLSVVHTTALRNTFDPSLERASYWERRGADEWRFANVSEKDLAQYPDLVSSLVSVNVNIDGRGALFCGRASDVPVSGEQVPLIIEVVIAGNLEAFFAIMGTLYEAAGYHGHVDVGVAVTGIQGAGSERRRRSFGGDAFAYSAPAFTRTARVAAAELRAPAEVANSLLRHFYEATTGIDAYNPFTQPQNRSERQLPRSAASGSRMFCAGLRHFEPRQSCIPAPLSARTAGRRNSGGRGGCCPSRREFKDGEGRAILTGGQGSPAARDPPLRGGSQGSVRRRR